MVDPAHIPCRLHWRKVRSPATLEALSETFAGRPSAAILGGNPAKADADGFSYWTAEPREIFAFTADETDPFARLESILGKYILVGGSAELPSSALFCGGWIGHFSYELGRHIERLPQRAVDDLPIPLIRLCFYDRVIAYDHRAEVFWLIALELPDDSETPAEKIAGLAHHLDQARQIPPAELPRVNIEDLDFAHIRRNMTHEDYLRAVRRIRDYIRDGDVYQVNFSHRFEQPFAGRPLSLFHWQNRFNPSGYAAYLDAGDHQIVSASPEMFLTIHEGTIRTKPIKGTRPRLDPSDPRSARRNEQLFHDLLTDEKERAELNMIIDLERNDVARICKPGTRRVVQPRTIETYPTVYHAVATVAGALRDGLTFREVLQAMFPGGSITGAPKIRAMEIIDELEPTARSVYTGAIGYLGVDGTVCLNIAIRTVIISGGRAFVQTGGGIVADSDPQAEWDETITKARALLAGLKAVAGP
ncbi:MAG: anthranilate synthase component I family protein [Planctomycetes bacterium]|nr:anthranilate synthase component I family protein [Planctomycetota bacterium]